MRRLLLLALSALLLAAAPARAADSPLRAGAASADITPPIGTPMFAYTARSRIAGPGEDAIIQLLGDPDLNLYAKTFRASEGIHTRLRSRAIVLERNGVKYALVQADLGGVPYELLQAVAERIRGSGIATDHILLSATHTHSATGPIWGATANGYAVLGGDLFDPRAFQVTADGVAEAILEANRHLVPASLAVGTTELTEASRNREFEQYVRNPEAPKDKAAASAAAIDTRMTVVRFDAVGGGPIGVWSNFAVHPTSFGDGNALFSGDNAGIAARVAEAEITAESVSRKQPPARPVVNVWTNGNQGDISPDGGPNELRGEPLEYSESDFSGAALAGIKVGAGIKAAWLDAGSRLTTEPDIDVRRTFVAFDGTAADGSPVGPLAVLGAGGILTDDGFCSPIGDLAGPGQGAKFPGAGGIGLIPSIVPISLLRIGSLGIGVYPSEITRTMGARIRNAITTAGKPVLSDTIIAGLTNAYMSYTSTPEEYDACSYEGSFTLFGRQQGARLRDVGIGLARALATGAAVTGSAAEPPSLSFGTTAQLPSLPTPNAGTVVKQPAETVKRFGRVTFTWNGGDRSIDAPRGATFVALQREAGGAWQTVSTDDSYADTVRRGPGNVYTEVHQFSACDPLGTYRFHVTGRASGGAYVVDSKPFTLAPITLVTGPVMVTKKRTAYVQLRYPKPSDDALLPLPRIVRSGKASVNVRRRGAKRSKPYRLRAEHKSGLFKRAKLPRGAVAGPVRVADDGCGNTLG